jgi:uncharacterized protein (TIGR02301 family)
MIGSAAFLITVALAARTPDQRQAMVDLAYVLGEAHALRQACEGINDQTWRARMSRMVEVEKPEEALQRRMVDNFNAGFASRQAEHPICGPDIPEAERATAERGRVLAQRLGGESP